jgi:carboxylesterase
LPARSGAVFERALARFRARLPQGVLRGPGPAPTSESTPGKAPALLALHGFGATPDEVGIVTAAAARLGLATRAPLLPGHGRSVRDLEQMRFEDWRAAALDALDALSREAPVICAGLSLGSLLCLDLALERPRAVAGLVLLANALWIRRPYPDFALRAVGAARIGDFWVPKGRPGIADVEARREHSSYDADPVHAAVSVMRAGDRLRKRLGEIRCPALIVHGAKDRICPLSNAWRAAQALGTTDVRVIVLPRSEHVITRDYDRDELARNVTEFLSNLARRAGGAEGAGAAP